MHTPPHLFYLTTEATLIPVQPSFFSIWRWSERLNCLRKLCSHVTGFTTGLPVNLHSHHFGRLPAPLSFSCTILSSSLAPLLPAFLSLCLSHCLFLYFSLYVISFFFLSLTHTLIFCLFLSALFLSHFLKHICRSWWSDGSQGHGGSSGSSALSRIDTRQCSLTAFLSSWLQTWRIVSLIGPVASSPNPTSSVTFMTLPGRHLSSSHLLDNETPWGLQQLEKDLICKWL